MEEKQRDKIPYVFSRRLSVLRNPFHLMEFPVLFGTSTLGVEGTQSLGPMWSFPYIIDLKIPVPTPNYSDRLLRRQCK